MENIQKSKRRRMQKENDTKNYEPMTTPGFLVRFKLPEPADKELVKRIKEKITDKNGSY